jgi:ribosomal protein L29
LNNTSKLALAKKDIARMKTILTERLKADKVAQTDKKEGAKA